MDPSPKRVLAQLIQTWGRLSFLQRISVVAFPLALVGSIAAIVTFVNQERYEILYGGLDSADAAEVVAALRQKRVPYRLEREGSAISIPTERIAEARMDLASQGLPRGGGMGFEVFDKSPFGMSDFLQDVNYQRAMERELERSVESIEVVDKARVHLVMPKESIFASDQNEAKASVVIRLKAGRRLQGTEVASITHLVASAVKGLKPEDVGLVDTSGKMLSDGASDENAPGVMTLKQFDVKDQIERYLTGKLLNILEPIVGEGKVRARADVQLNMARVEKTLEQYDPAGAVVRSEQKTKEKRGSAGPAGVPGAESNLPGGQAAAVAAGSSDEASSSTVSYEINKTVQHLVEPVGTITRLSVAVVVDNVQEPQPAGQPEEATPPPSRPRSAEEMTKITDLVKAAVGFDAARGDTVRVENVAYGPAPGGGADARAIEQADRREFYIQIAKYPAILLAAVLVFFLVLRPLMRSFGATVQALGSTLSSQGPADGQRSYAEIGALAVPAALPAALKEQVREIASRDPEKAARLLKKWIAEEGV